MDNLYLLVIILLALAVVDLVVGVSNDAVNFLHSAIGSKIAKRNYIYMVAALGLVIGAMFSGGMMDVLRKGVFYPQHLYLDQLLIIFLSVMITDIILIDLFNTFGFPTSTTIAIVFEMMGAGLAIALIIISGDNHEHLKMIDLINTEGALIILGGIVASIILAFVSGILVQFVARMLFTFRYKGRFKFMFSIGGAISITAIFFLIFRKETVFIDLLYASFNHLAEFSMVWVLILIFCVAFILFLIVSYVFHIDIPRVVVFFGTFTLALSFASNDLVNFIGIPLSALEGINVFKSTGAQDASSFLMNIWVNGQLNHVLGGNYYHLIFFIAGIIMVITLFSSRKLRSVTETEIYLGRQDAGYESFEPSQLSRILVWRFLKIYKKLRSGLPHLIVKGIASRYDRSVDVEIEEDQSAYFDTVRASVNLVVASILIAYGTYLKIPLSTTFVVFMVSMGTSLSDQAWGRESAVYRVSGVLSILGGWFITASIAFLGAFVIAIFIWWLEMYAVLILLVLIAFVLYRSTKYHKRIYFQQRELKEETSEQVENNIAAIIELGSERIRKHILESSKIYMLIIDGFVYENIKQLKETCVKAKFLDKLARNTKNELFHRFSALNNESFDFGHHFIQALGYLGELSNTLQEMAVPVYNHVENQHKGLSKSQKEDALILLEEVTGFFNYLVHIEKDYKFESIPELIEKQKYILELIEELRKKQIKRIMDGVGKTRSSILLLECYAESKNMVLYAINLLKSQRDFYTNARY
jgi:phosphate/sulfate permease